MNCVSLSTGTKDVNFVFAITLYFSVEVLFESIITAIYMLLDCYQGAYHVFFCLELWNTGQDEALIMDFAIQDSW